MERKLEYDTPTQVMFLDPDTGDWLVGIAYRDEIICGCCGSIYEISEIYDECLEIVPDPVRVYQEWVDITDAIHGGENAYSPYEPEEDELIAAGDVEDEEAWEHSINAKFFDSLD